MNELHRKAIFGILRVRELPGYADYRGAVRHRLIPHVW